MSDQVVNVAVAFYFSVQPALSHPVDSDVGPQWLAA